MNVDFEDTFAHHEIRSSIVQANFGSWLLMKRHPSKRAGEDGGFTGVFWVRITAADGLLRVSGDFDPIIFQGHLSFDDDPIGRVAWMGGQTFLSSYVCEKARTGSGRDACTSWSTGAAHDDLRDLSKQFESEVQDAAREEYGEDSKLWPDEALKCAYVDACTAGLEAFVQYDGREGVQEILETVSASDVPDMEWFYIIGQRPSQGLKLAHRAVQRLHVLLKTETRGAA